MDHIQLRVPSLTIHTPEHDYMTPLQLKYLAFNTKWQLTRELEGYIEDGMMRLSDERESEFAAPMTDLWHQMTDSEQDELEAVLGFAWKLRQLGATSTLEAPADLGLVDVIPQSGQLPRKSL